MFFRQFVAVPVAPSASYLDAFFMTIFSQQRLVRLSFSAWIRSFKQSIYWLILSEFTAIQVITLLLVIFLHVALFIFFPHATQVSHSFSPANNNQHSASPMQVQFVTRISTHQAQKQITTAMQPATSAVKNIKPHSQLTTTAVKKQSHTAKAPTASKHKKSNQKIISAEKKHPKRTREATINRADTAQALPASKHKAASSNQVQLTSATPTTTINKATSNPPSNTANNANEVLQAAQYQADYLNNPDPSYPRLSRRLGEEGKTILRVKVSSKGEALMIELQQSSGYKRLDRAAMKAVRDWRFIAAVRGKQAIESWVLVPVNFGLTQRA